jgi:GTPase SAR1 family protein
VGRFLPSQRPTIEEVEVGNVNIKAYDLGGHMASRDIWEDYYTLADAVVYMVDAGDRERLEESAEALWELVRKKRDAPLERSLLLVVGNKTDLPDAAPPEQLRAALRLDELAPAFRACALFPVSLHTGAGYREAFKWLEDNL